MSSLLVVVRFHLFLALYSPQFVHLSRMRGKVAAVTTSAHCTGERSEVAAINRGERAWHKEANTEHTRVLTGGKRGGGVLSCERSGGGSHWEEWRGGSVLSGMRGKAWKATAVSRAGREKPETVAKR